MENTMLCTNGHNNADTAIRCAVCGITTFQVPVIAVGNQAGYSGLAIASMVLGIVWVWWIGSILALVFGYVARRQIKRTGQKGNGMAIAGIVLGWVGVATLVAGIIVFVVGGFSSNSTTQALHACEADGATISVAMAAFSAQHPGVTVTESELLGATDGGPYLQNWAYNPNYYSFNLLNGTLYVQGVSGSTPIAYTGPNSCTAIGL
jgi:hypothetical protein